jgi:hypothetical protein
MNLQFIILFFGIIILILYHLFEAWGIYEFEPFAYKMGITIKKITLKTKAKSFDNFERTLFRKDNINYKFVSHNICLVRFGKEKVPWFMYRRPIPQNSYRVIIKNDKYIVSLKISFLYFIIIGFLVYNIITKILRSEKLAFDDLMPLILYSSVCVSIIFFSISNMKRVAISFLKIIKET